MPRALEDHEEHTWCEQKLEQLHVHRSELSMAPNQASERPREAEQRFPACSAPAGAQPRGIQLLSHWHDIDIHSTPLNKAICSPRPPLLHMYEGAVLWEQE